MDTGDCTIKLIGEPWCTIGLLCIGKWRCLYKWWPGIDYILITFTFALWPTLTCQTVLFTLVPLLYTFATGYRSQFVQLVSLQPLIPHLNKLGLLSREEQQELTNPHHTEDRRIRKLLDIVAGKGPEGYTLLKDALREEITHTGHGILSGILYNVPRGKYCPLSSMLVTVLCMCTWSCQI